MAISISEVFSRIPEPRVTGLIDYPLPALLNLVLLGKLCGRVTPKSAWRMGMNLPVEHIKKLGFPKGKMPAYSTISDKKRGKTTVEIAYGITSLPPNQADAQRLLELNRNHWGIENKLHCVRDTIFF